MPTGSPDPHGWSYYLISSYQKVHFSSHEYLSWIKNTLILFLEVYLAVGDIWKSLVRSRSLMEQVKPSTHCQERVKQACNFKTSAGTLELSSQGRRSRRPGTHWTACTQLQYDRGWSILIHTHFRDASKWQVSLRCLELAAQSSWKRTTPSLMPHTMVGEDSILNKIGDNTIYMITVNFTRSGNPFSDTWKGNLRHLKTNWSASWSLSVTQPTQHCSLLEGKYRGLKG